MEPQIQYAKTSDGVSIAFWTLGEGKPLVCLPVGLLSHLEMEWQIPEVRSWYERLAAGRMLIRYDPRGLGLSQRDAVLSLDSGLLDVEAVVDQLGVDKFALLGHLHDGLIAMAYAAAHPQRLTNLILWCSWATTSEYYSSAAVQSLASLRDQDWETYTETTAQAFTGWSGELARRVAEVYREATTQEQLLALGREWQQWDVAPILPSITAPTLVLNRRQFRLVPVEFARALASQIPNARLVLLEGESGAPFTEDVEEVVNVIQDFLGGSVAAVTPPESAAADSTGPTPEAVDAEVPHQPEQATDENEAAPHRNDVTEVPAIEPATSSGERRGASEVPSVDAELQIRFCTSADGTQLAYAIVGGGPGTPLVVVGDWTISQELYWRLPEGRGFYAKLARRRKLVMFDRRGVGASQRDVDDVSLESQLADVSAIVDHLELQRFDLISYDSVLSVPYAARYPERVERLVLWAPLARNPDAEARTHDFEDLVRTNWQLARRAIAGLIIPTGPDERQRWLSSVLRESISPEVAAKYIDFAFTADIEPNLPQIKAATLVLHRRGDRVSPFSGGRRVATLIPNARFVALDGDISSPIADDHAEIAELVVRFLDEGRDVSAGDDELPPGTVRAVLFTDLVGHTEMMSRLGDEKGREVLREHERITREALAAYGGTEVKTMGDGFMASFGSVTKAVECAIRLQRAFAGREGEPLSVRVGLNAGEPIEEDGDLFGATVILASRIAARANGGEILVADTVRGLCSGKGFLFADREDFVAKGFDDPVRVYEVRWREGD